LRRHQLAQMLIIGAVASALGIALALAIDWFPKVGSTQAQDIDDLFDVLLIASVPIFVLVQSIVLFSVWKFRMRPGEELKDGPPIHGNTMLEVVWTTIPALILVCLCAYAYVVLGDLEERKPGTMVVNVTGEQFAWTFQYPGENGAKAFKSDQLFLPANRPVEFKVRSKDVIHDFWVPEFRLKIDAVPGITTEYRVTTTGTTRAYPVVCAELCGLGHATMRQTAHVISQSEFESWMARKRKEAQST
jgi:cytochrome c oxidase subunit II